MVMDDKIKQALSDDLTIDIITTGRKSGKPRRIEIWFHQVADKIYITGTPGKRDWYANLLENRNLVFCLKESVVAEMPAFAHPITDPTQRHQILTHPKMSWYHNQVHSLQDFLDNAPLVEITFTNL
jgi:hypothetical protein